MVFARQHPAAIDAGVFHNDVIATSHLDTLLVHERAWVDQERVLAELAEKFQAVCGQPLQTHVVAEADLSLDDAVASYVFNAQMVDGPDGGRTLLVPEACEDHDQVKAVLDLWQQAGALDGYELVSLAQSMDNGGGPACLRLRVVMTEAERAAVAEGVWLTEGRAEALRDWARTHLRERLTLDDLADPVLVAESEAAVMAAKACLGL